MAKQGTKQEIWAKAYTLDFCHFEGPLKSVKEQIDALITAHGENARLDYGQHELYSDSYSYALEVKRLETDEEFDARIHREEKWAEQQRERDEREFAALAAKLGKKIVE